MLKSIDIFCDIIDNFGDIGFVYRLAREVKRKEQDIRVRVFLNDAETFSKINKNISIGKKIQMIENITYYDMREMSSEDYRKAGNSEVAIEAYGCDIPEAYLENSSGKLKIIVNIEYLTGEEWAKEYHLQSSYINVKGVKKYFYMPGFENWSGGLIINGQDSLIDRAGFFNNVISCYSEKVFPVNSDLSIDKDTFIGTVFSYEYNFQNFLDTLEDFNKKVTLLVFGDMSKNGFLITKNLKTLKNTKVVFMDYVEQNLYDKILYNSDFNLVRGEESFSRAIVSRVPFLWHAYCQEEREHLNKVEGFLSFLKDKIPENFYESYSKITYNYNCRTENHYNLEEEDFYGFFQEFEKKKETFKYLSDYVKKNGNLADKLLCFLKEKLSENDF
ncbi:elongation factor P maturation arginine rhamnosyltransferase EarP [uncultured Ilyobacter sp.]|uniref:elongation factor P maturation arginine rhamnosyltransferase EarP n=1 Tax=uncultured Ilyobacter sp. TaxID=544433 RepID=UPI0029F5AA29|nr:elongation factor P maturation arginine rhamnosyltransferase EarP [uncultured Ilyobacter sp.]